MSDRAGLVEPPGQEWYEGRFDEIVGGTLELAAAAGAVLFVFFAVLNLVLFEPPASYALFVVALATAAVAGTLWWWARTRLLSSRRAHPAIAVGLGTILVHTFAAARVEATPEMTFWFALVALAGGILFLSWRWFAGLSTAVVAAWAVVAAIVPPDPGWMLHGPFVLLASIVLGGVTLAGRRRVYRDLIDRELRLRRVNRELDVARRKAERAEGLQSRFLANISHDVRTPASAIIGEARDLRTDEVSEEQAEILASMEENARHLVRLFDDVLDVSLAEAGQLSIKEEAFELERLLQQSLDLVARPARDKGLELTSQIGDDVPPIVRTDPHRLKQVLGNLLSNAVKFTDTGTVELRASLADAEDTVLRFEVEDTGPGVPEERRGELFRPFGRLEASPDVEGTGLGLAICQRIVDLVGGRIDVEATPGEGSTFWFTWPVEPAQAEEVDADAEPVRLAGHEVWIAGTEGFPAPVLERWGLDVETMPGIGFVEEALEEGRRPALIVLDLLTIQAPEAFLAERVGAWQAKGIPVLISKPPELEGNDLVELVGPERVFAPTIPEKDLHEAVANCLRERRGSAGSAIDAGLGERHPLSILVVEDSPVNRRLVVALVSRLGYEPDAVGSGEEALTRLEEERFDLVFLDLGLPGIDGNELARRIHDELDHPPRLVALTGHSGEEIRREAEAAGIAGYLVKPVEAEDVVAEIEATPSRSTDDAGDAARG